MSKRSLPLGRTKHQRASAALLSAALLSSLGCARQLARPAAAAEAAPKPSRVTELEAELEAREARINQLENRLSLLEAGQRELRFAVAESSPPPAPQLGIRETVRLGHAEGDQGAPHRDEPDEAEPPPPRRDARPVLRLIGRMKEPTASEPLPPVPVVSERLPLAPVPSIEDARSADPSRLYEQAVDLLRRRAFAESLAVFTDLLARYPRHALAPRAMFWRGEILFAQRDYQRALTAFEGSLARDPAGDKAPDALLKVGLCHKRLGSVERGNAVLERLKAQFPQSEAARLAAQEDA